MGFYETIDGFLRRRIRKVATNLSLHKQPALPVVLMYHAIAKADYDPNGICVSPEQFKYQMLYLKQHNLRGVSVREFLRAQKAGNAKGLIGLTFDDGYSNFLKVALPILEDFGFSATVFMVAGMLGKD